MITYTMQLYMLIFFKNEININLNHINSHLMIPSFQRRDTQVLRNSRVGHIHIEPLFRYFSFRKTIHSETAFLVEETI